MSYFTRISRLQSGMGCVCSLVSSICFVLIVPSFDVFYALCVQCFFTKRAFVISVNSDWSLSRSKDESFKLCMAFIRSFNKLSKASHMFSSVGKRKETDFLWYTEQKKLHILNLQHRTDTKDISMVQNFWGLYSSQIQTGICSYTALWICVLQWKAYGVGNWAKNWLIKFTNLLADVFMMRKPFHHNHSFQEMILKAHMWLGVRMVKWRVLLPTIC